MYYLYTHKCEKNHVSLNLFPHWYFQCVTHCACVTSGLIPPSASLVLLFLFHGNTIHPPKKPHEPLYQDVALFWVVTCVHDSASGC